MATKSIFFLLISISNCWCNDLDLPTVQTKLGLVQGYTKTSLEGRKFSAFEGIPFAKPPIGERRFEPPEPVEPWHGVWQANFLTECAQIEMFGRNITTNEDCLYLNVYVPNDIKSKNLDVIVHIHGGAYQYCSGHTYSHPEVLMDRDVIFVTFNYRLNMLGFLTTEDEVVPGNNGMKDQVLALKWVQDHIASFGGNPNSVTITGISAGGSSVHLHYFSELSRGLFHRGISHSGSALNTWSVQRGGLEKAQQLAHSVGCPTTNSKIMVKCLKTKPTRQIVEKLRLFFEYQILPAVPFGPTIEKTGSKPFLKDDPYKLLIKGEVYDVPWIDSTTTHDGSFPVMYIPNMMTEVGEKWEELAPSILHFNYTLPKSSWKKAANIIKEEFLGDDGFKKENADNFLKIFTERYFTADAETAVRTQAKVAKSPIYSYVFGYPGDNNPQKLVGHASDAKYFFGLSSFVTTPFTPDELKMKDLLVDMLISFAKTGVPKFGEVDWKPTEFEKLTYLNVAGIKPEEIRLETVDELTKRKFWKSLEFQENENLLKTKDEL